MSTWQKLESGLMDGGGINFLIPVTFVVLFLINLSDQILKGQNPLQRLEYTLPFIFLALLTYFIRNKYLHSAIYLLLGIGTFLLQSEHSDHSAIAPIIFSMYIIKKKSYFLVVCIITIVATAAKGQIYGQSINQAFYTLLAYAFYYTTYYLLIYRESTNKIDIKNKNLTKEQLRIIDMIGRKGMIQKEVAYELGITVDVLYNKLYEIRKLYSDGEKTITLNQLIYRIAVTGKSTNQS